MRRGAYVSPLFSFESERSLWRLSSSSILSTARSMDLYMSSELSVTFRVVFGIERVMSVVQFFSLPSFRSENVSSTTALIIFFSYLLNLKDFSSMKDFIGGVSWVPFEEIIRDIK